MEISYQKGIVISEGTSKIILDPEYSTTPIGIPVLISHAHSDHTQGISSSAVSYVNEITLELYKASQTKNPRYIKNVINYEPFEIDNFEIEFINAGHLLGASQIIVRSGNHSIHYTGDFCPEDLMTVKAADIPKDVNSSIIDSTYGNNRILFNNRSTMREQLFNDILKIIMEGNIPVISIAKLGGAQELIAFLNTMGFKNILTHHKISAINEIYRKYGIELSYTDLNSVNPKKLLSSKSIIFIPRSLKNIESLIPNYQSIKKLIKKIIVSGQTAKYQFNKFDFAYPISTHASYPELINTIQKIKPSRVFTHWGYEKIFANLINNNNKIKCPAYSIKNMKNYQLIDEEFKSKTQVYSKSNSLENWFD